VSTIDESEIETAKEQADVIQEIEGEWFSTFVVYSVR
jgi:hypothetical protein